MSFIKQLVMKKLMMKLQAKQPPQKNGVVLTIITPERASVGISIIPNSKAIPIDFARIGCLPKTYWQMGELLFRVEKPSSAPKNAPVNKVIDMVTSLA
jgi:hypothetical protein